MPVLSYTLRAIDYIWCRKFSQPQRMMRYKIHTLILTFFVYCTYHISRKPISVVKNVLSQNCSERVDPDNTNNSHWCDWPPFDGDNANELLGYVDSFFLFAYAFGVFVSGAIGERMDLRIFLFIGMVLSGLFNIMFGLAYSFNIHSLWYFYLTQALSGLAQSTGWPAVVTAVGNWYGKGSRGLIFGVWNSHTSLGNILGTLIAAVYVDNAWSYSFIVPGCIIIALGVVVLLTLVPDPTMIGLINPNNPTRAQSVSYDIKDKEAGLPKLPDEEKAISFIGALKIPGVVEFSLCLFFAKLVSYTFTFWLPNYIDTSTNYTASQSAYISIFFDVGGIIGGILAGVLRDQTGMPASICNTMLILSVPLMYVYNMFGDVTIGLNIFLLIVVGLFVNGPYGLITTAVSADLGTHESLKGNSKALATVSAIIDGTGSIGAAVGPLIAGNLSETDWSYVFYMMMISELIAMILLVRLVIHETRDFLHRRKEKKSALVV